MGLIRRKNRTRAPRTAPDEGAVAQDGDSAVQTGQSTSINPMASYHSLATTLVAESEDEAPEPQKPHEPGWSLLELVNYCECLGGNAWSESLVPIFSEYESGERVLGTRFSQVPRWPTSYKSVGQLGGEVLAAWLADLSTRRDETFSDRVWRSLKAVTNQTFEWPGNLHSAETRCQSDGCTIVSCLGESITLQLYPPLHPEEVVKFWETVNKGERPEAYEEELDDEWFL